jgi:hypothetical protein
MYYRKWNLSLFLFLPWSCELERKDFLAHSFSELNTLSEIECMASKDMFY